MSSTNLLRQDFLGILTPLSAVQDEHGIVESGRQSVQIEQSLFEAGVRVVQGNYGRLVACLNVMLSV